MKKLILIAVLGLVLNPLMAVRAETYKETIQKELEDLDQEQIQEDLQKAKEDTSDAIYDNLGTILEPTQQQAAWSKVFKAMDLIIDEAIEEVKGSPNIPAEEKQKIVDALKKIDANLNECEEGINSATTQEELNIAYQSCVENVKQSINEFMNVVYDVTYALVDELLIASKKFLAATRSSVNMMKSCGSIDTTDIDEILASLDQGDGLYDELKAHYDATVDLEYTRENMALAISISSKLSAVMARIYEEYEDQYYIYVDGCGNDIPELDNVYEDLKQEAADEIIDEAEQYKDYYDKAKELVE